MYDVGIKRTKVKTRNNSMFFFGTWAGLGPNNSMFWFINTLFSISSHFYLFSPFNIIFIFYHITYYITLFFSFFFSHWSVTRTLFNNFILNKKTQAGITKIHIYIRFVLTFKKKIRFALQNFSAKKSCKNSYKSLLAPTQNKKEAVESLCVPTPSSIYI